MLYPVAFEPIKPLIEERSLFGCTLFQNHKIFIVGGVSSKKNGCTDSIEIYDIIKDNWTLSCASLPLKLCGLSCLSVEEKNQILIFGGSDAFKNHSKLVFEYQINESRLREYNFMLKKRQMNNKVYKIEKQFYLLGGNMDADWEIWKEITEDYEPRIQKEVISYSDILKNDLNNFCSFII